MSSGRRLIGGGWRFIAGMRCLVRSHDDDTVHEERRVFLRCRHCGRESRGWEIEVAFARTVQGSSSVTS